MNHAWKRFTLGVARERRQLNHKDRSKAKAQPRTGYKKRSKR